MDPSPTRSSYSSSSRANSSSSFLIANLLRSTRPRRRCPWVAEHRAPGEEEETLVGGPLGRSGTSRGEEEEEEEEEEVEDAPNRSRSEGQFCLLVLVVTILLYRHMVMHYEA